MPVYTIAQAQAKDLLSKLVDEAIAGEDVTIARYGKPVVELRPARPPGSDPLCIGVESQSKSICRSDIARLCAAEPQKPLIG
jgi:antitoxin (DNA-binding transcriptional repressor) of toxin-antitoxin stability system